MARLHTLARTGGYEEAVICISEGADINALSVHSFTPLMLAAENQHLPIVRLLLESGAQVNVARRNGHTALHMAAAKGHLDIVQALVKAGADMNSVSKFGSTAMIDAARHNHREIVAFLKDQGADAGRRFRDFFTSVEMTADEWLDVGGIGGWRRKRFPEDYPDPDNPNVRPLARESSERHVLKLMADGLTPEEYVAKHGRYTCVFSYGHYSFRDLAVETWAHGVAEGLFTPGLMEQYEEQFLQGEELEGARQLRARHARIAARRNKKKNT